MTTAEQALIEHCELADNLRGVSPESVEGKAWRARWVELLSALIQEKIAESK